MKSIADYRKTLTRLRKVHLFLCLFGLLASAYSFYVEINLEKDPNYTALCDISPGISCTAVFGSKWGKGFGFIGLLLGEDSVFNQPNAVYGAISYPLFALAARFEYMFFAKITLLIGIVGVLLSAYLAYVLFYILNDMCVVCVSIYVTNVLLLLISLWYHRTMKNLIESQDRSGEYYIPTVSKTEKKRV